jgi:hypothetical protein
MMRCYRRSESLDLHPSLITHEICRVPQVSILRPGIALFI